MKLKYIGSARSPCSLYVVKRVRRSGGDGRGENKEAKEKVFFFWKSDQKKQACVIPTCKKQQNQQRTKNVTRNMP